MNFTPPNLPDPLKHFAKDKPLVKLLALALVLSPAILSAASLLARAFKGT